MLPSGIADNTDTNNKSWFDKKYEAAKEYFTLKKMYERFKALHKPKEITMNAAFTAFFLTLLFAALASLEMGILGVIILLEAFNIAFNYFEAKTLNLPRPARIALNIVAAVLSVAVITVIVGGFIPAIAGVIAAATPFVFLTVMAYAVGLNAWFAYDAGRKNGAANELIKKLNKDETVEEKEEKVLTSLVSNTTKLAFFGLKKLLNTPDIIPSNFLKNLTDKELKNNIIASLGLNMSDEDTENLTLEEIQTRLVVQMNKESGKFIQDENGKPAAIMPLNENGTYNHDFFSNMKLVISALEKSAAEQSKRSGYHVFQSIVLGSVFAGIAVALGPVAVVGAAIGGGIIAGAALVKMGIVAATTGLLGANTLYSLVTARPEKTEEKAVGLGYEPVNGNSYTAIISVESRVPAVKPAEDSGRNLRPDTNSYFDRQVSNEGKPSNAGVFGTGNFGTADPVDPAEQLLEYENSSTTSGMLG